MSKKRILFFAEAVTLAHVARPLVLAQALNPDLYDIYLACDPRFDQLFPDLPFPCRTIQSIPCESFIRALAAGRPVYDTKTLRDYVTEDLAVIEEMSPDLVVGDFRLSLAVSTPLSGVPYMTISNAYWSPYAKQRYMVPELPVTRVIGVVAAQALFRLVHPVAFALHTIPLNRVRREHGLAHLGWDLRRIYTWADHTLYADVPALIPTQDLPANHHYIGPVLWSPGLPSPDWWDKVPSDKPLVYVTLGSSGRSDLVPAVLQALADMPVILIAATAGRVSVGKVPDNVFLADYLPGDVAVARSQLVVCNGGSPTTQQALAQGRPVLGIPSNLDQHLNMAAVRRQGAGESIRSEQASARKIRETARKILDTPIYAQAATRLAREFSNFHAPSRFATLVKAVI